MILQILRFLVGFLFFTSFCFCQGQNSDLEKELTQLRKEVNGWMKPYQRQKAVDFEQWTRSEDKNPDNMLNHQIYKYMDEFYQFNKERYIGLRKADLERYEPAPETLPGYQKVENLNAVFKDAEFNIDLDLLSDLVNIQTFQLTDTRSFIPTFSIFSYLLNQKGISNKELSSKLFFGDLWFADLIQGDEWQITLVNRIFALKFKWNVATNRISVSDFWIYEGKKQIFGWLNNQFPKTYTKLQQLTNDLNSYRWKLYDQEPDTDDFFMNEIEEFYRINQKKYIKLRNQELSKNPPIDLAYFQTFPYEELNVKNDILSSFQKEDNGYKLFLPAFEIDGLTNISLIYSTIYFYKRNVGYDFGIDYILNSIVAVYGMHSQKLDKSNWEIQFFFRDYAVSYHWNIVTDEISSIKVMTNKIVEEQYKDFEVLK